MGSFPKNAGEEGEETGGSSPFGGRRHARSRTPGWDLAACGGCAQENPAARRVLCTS